ncbi:lytic transglycosylase domain-containing protein, partial [Tepidiforma sp.]|uniref:lytic transglycosylase domain-containing protein n=1 Tax=Tepidiforma sp. TaxID=2682230 RepID=UPI002ADDC5E8
AGSTLAASAAYRQLRALNDLARFGEAAALPAVTADGPLAAYAAFERGRALAGIGEAAAATAAWEALLADLHATAALRAAALEALAGLARDAGDREGLARWLDARIAFDGSAAARYERAILAQEMGAPEFAVGLLQAILVATPLAPEATLAIAELRDLGAEVDPGQEGFILYRRGAYAEAARLLSAAVDEPGLAAADRTYRAYYLAASLEELGRAAEAVAWYDAAAATGATSPFVHRGQYWAARVLENNAQLADAGERYVRLATLGPAGEFTGEAAFRAGFTLLRADDPAGALAAWEEVGAAPSARLEYWRGRALDLLGRFEEARAAYRAALAAGPLDFHGFEAAVRLGEAEPLTGVAYRPRDLTRGVDWEAIAAWLRGRIGGDWTGAPATGACELAAAGLARDAAAELLAAANGAGAWRLLELAREAHGCGFTSTALSLAVRLRQEAGAASHEVPPDLLRVAYPVAYPAALDAAARARDIDPLFFAALIRAESLWDPGAGSSAGALGLTQVIPSTGRGIAAALGVEGFEPADLFRPAVALEFGAYYLGVQLGRFRDPLLALAAYNAGPGNALRWAALERSTAADLAESIDFSETRAYVQVIVDAYLHYQRAWSE